MKNTHTELVWPGKQTGVERIVLPLRTVETVEGPSVEQPRLPFREWPENYPRDWKNKLIWGDNKSVMASLSNEFEGQIDLIYIDPPFGTGTTFETYSDTWGQGRSSYLQMMYERLALMYQLLSYTGSIYVHLDYRMDSCIRLIMDELFGEDNLRNEIIWSYSGRGGKAIAGQYPRNHDTLYLYSKNGGATYNRVYIEEVVPIAEWSKHGFQVDQQGRVFKTASGKDHTEKRIRELKKQGRIYKTRTGRVRVKYFLETRGNSVIEKKLIGDVWSDIPDMMHTPLAERLHFPTQKPEALLERIIKVSSNEGDLVADFFCGSGTTGAVAEKLGRRWIMCDNSHSAIQTARKRLLNLHNSKDYDRPARLFEVMEV